MAQHADNILMGVPRGGDEFIQNRRFLIMADGVVALGCLANNSCFAWKFIRDLTSPPRLLVYQQRVRYS